MPHEERKVLVLALAHGLEHEVGWVLLSRRATDPDADPEVVSAAEGLIEGVEPVVTAVAASQLHADRVRGDVQLVVDGDEPGWLDPVLLGEGGIRRARLV